MTRTLRHERMDYLVADADLLPQDLGWWAVLRTRAVDELTGAPPLNRVTLTTTTRGCLPRVAENGLCGLIARPRDVSGQMLTAGAFTAELRADGYLPRSLTAAIDAARRTTASAAAGATQLSIAPPEPAPPATRRQFVAGRGVLLETRTPNTPHEFSVVAEPAIAPAPGIVPLSNPVQAPRPAAGAPWQVAGVPLVLSDQPLHRAEPAILRASARLQSTAGALPIPAPAAEVGLTGVWWTFAEIPANSSPPHPPDLVSLRAPLAFDHPAAILERLASRTPDGVARALAATGFAGASQIELSNVSGLLAGGGDALEIETAGNAERELVITAGFTPPVAGVMRATVRLRTPLAFAHRAGAPALRATLIFAPLGPLAREAQRGDRVLFADTLLNVATDDVLRVDGGSPRAELRFVRRLPVYAAAAGVFSHTPALDPDGAFALPSIARVAQLQLFVRHAGQAPHAPIDLVPDYRGDNTLQILFKP